MLDVAEACGSLRVADARRDPLGASSRGAGELIRAAIEDGALRIVIGVGGTASTDGGTGLRDAIGAVPDDVELVAALDVQNPLLGPDGAAAAFGPQKGASPARSPSSRSGCGGSRCPPPSAPGPARAAGSAPC